MLRSEVISRVSLSVRAAVGSALGVTVESGPGSVKLGSSIMASNDEGKVSYAFGTMKQIVIYDMSWYVTNEAGLNWK
jgi:ABC-type phosphonate transport system ATPase subunit